MVILTEYIHYENLSEIMLRMEQTFLKKDFLWCISKEIVNLFTFETWMGSSQ